MRRGRHRTAFLPILLLGVTACARIALPFGGVCPEPSAGSLLGDPVVKQALDDAWKASDANGGDPHEEGGFILQCLEGNQWVTKIEDWPPGTFDKITHGPPDVPDNCQLVGEFHTHPPAAEGDPQNAPYHNEQPSGSDEKNADDYGIPGILLFSQPGDNDPTSINYGDNDHPTTPCPDTPPTDAELAADAALSAGEPHLRTFDGLDYDFQTAGEFVLARDPSGTFEIQTRQEPTASGRVTMNTAVAARVDGAVVEVNADAIVVDGTARPRQEFTEHRTPGGGTVTADGGTVRYRWADGSQMSVVGPAIAIVASEGRRGTVEGLLGNFDGRTGNDLVGPDGTSLRADGRVTTAERHGPLADAWRVTAATSLFTYPVGTSTKTYDRREFPTRSVRARHLDPKTLARARQVCTRRGIRDATLLDGCAFDLALTGRDIFVSSAARVDRETRRMLAARHAETPLITAVQSGRLADVQTAIGNGADIDATDASGRSALHWAVLAGRSDLAGALLDAGADPKIADDAGSTALHVAALFGLGDLADRLIAAGADVHARNDAGLTPADLATRQGNADLAARLR